MQQIENCIDRALRGEKPLAHKYKAIVNEVGLLYLYHYHHLLLIYNTLLHEAIYQWHETPTDKRGLEAALKYLETKGNRSLVQDEAQKRTELKLAAAAYKDFMGQRTSFNNDADIKKARELAQKVMDLKYELRKPIDTSKLKSMAERKSAIPPEIVIILDNGNYCFYELVWKLVCERNAMEKYCCRQPNRK